MIVGLAREGLEKHNAGRVEWRRRFECRVLYFYFLAPRGEEGKAIQENGGRKASLMSHWGICIPRAAAAAAAAAAS